MALFLLTPFLNSVPARALSELKPVTPAESEQLPAGTLPPLDGPQVGPDGGLPDPQPVIRPAAEETDVVPGQATDTPQAEFPPADVLTDLSLLPEPVARMRELVMEAARTGDPERMRALLGAGPTATRLTPEELDIDPVEYLKSLSGDPEGREILAIILDLFSTGFVHMGEGTAQEVYLWPYFAVVPLESLTPPQRVELLRLVTAGDVEDMLSYGSYNFYRIGIAPDGAWRFFLAVD